MAHLGHGPRAKLVHQSHRKDGSFFSQKWVDRMVPLFRGSDKLDSDQVKGYRQRMTKVLLVSDRSLFSQGIEDLLRVEEAIEFVGRWARNEARQDSIEACEPDVILVDCADPADCPVLRLMGCLRGGLVQRITCVSPDENSIFLLSGERREMTDIKDLVHAITGDAPVLRLVEPHGCALRSAGLTKEAKPGRNQLTNETNDDGVEPKQIGGFNG